MRTLALLACMVCAACAEDDARQKAVDAKLTPAYNKCMEANQSTPGMIDCVTAEFGVQDGRLNTVYRKLMRMFANEAKRAEALRAAQKLWVQFRDANCNYVASEAEGGTMQPLEFEQCRLTMTVERTTELGRELGSEK